MKHKAQILIFVLCVSYMKHKAQNYFNNRYDNTGSFDLAPALDTFQHKYLTVGSEGFTGFNIALSLYLFNQDGTVYKKKTYGWPGDNLQANDGNYIRQGSNQFYACGSWVYFGYNSKAFLWRFDSNLDSMKFTSYGYPYSNNILNTFIKHRDNKIYMIGYVDDTLQTNADILLIKTDTAGNEIWKKKIGIMGMDENAISIDTLQGDLIIAGLRIVHNTSSTDGFVMRLDTAGNTVWQKIVNTNGGYSGSKVLTLKDGNILVHNRYKAYTVGSNEYYRLQVQKITSNNVLIWQKKYNVAAMYADPSGSIIENTQGNLVMAGQKGYADNSITGTVNVLNQNGDSLFYKEFYQELGSQNYFRDVIQTTDKGYCFAGFLIPVFANGGTGTEDIWLLKVDSNFCESALPCSSGVGISEQEAIEGGVKIYPNPASSVLNIEFLAFNNEPATIQIIDAFGKNVLFEKLNSQVSVFNINNLSSGIYFYKIIMGNTLIKSNKLIIQK